MPLTDLATIAVLSKLGSGWEIIDQELESPEQGWDVLTLDLIKDYGGTVKTIFEVAAEWPIGKRAITGKDFWVVRRAPMCIGGNIWRMKVVAQGMTAGRPIKATIHTTAESQGMGPILIGPPFWDYWTTVAKGTILEANPTLNVSYVLIGAAPPTDRLGRPGAEYQTPPVDIPVRPTVWTYLADPTYNFPHGWVFSDMDADPLSGTDEPVSLVNEVWTYRYLATP